MFVGLHRRSEQWRDADRSLRLENTGTGLAAALRGMGQGAQPYLGEDVNQLAVSLLAVAGADDPRYTRHAEAMVRAVPDGVVEVVENAGHSVIGEMPDHIATLVGGFIGLPT